MSIRTLALYFIVAGLSIYAWKDWFVSLCGLIVMMAFMQHEDMPTKMFGIQGLNVWNVLFLMILLAWAAARRREQLEWDMPRHIALALLMCLGVVVTGVLRAAIDRSHIESYSLGSLISEELINTIKWVLPGVLLFDGCRTRRRVIMALVCVLAMYWLVSIQVVKQMPFESAFGGGEGIQKVRLRVCSRIGYSACDTSPMLAGAFWGMMASLPLIRRKRLRLVVLGLAGIVMFGQALTGGRAGYLAWGATGLVLCLLKWRKHLILAPLVVVLLPIAFPGTVDRMLFGVGQTDVTGSTVNNTYEMTSGRVVIWPYVIDKIGESVLVGHGRLAMNRTGLTDQLMTELQESFPHPHNMYLETLLDNGIIGSLPFLWFFAAIVAYSAMLFRSSNRLYSAIGGLTLSAVLVQLIAGVGAQHVYPRESTLGMWVTMFLSLRVYVEEARARLSETTAGSPWGEIPSRSRWASPLPA